MSGIVRISRGNPIGGMNPELFGISNFQTANAFALHKLAEYAANVLSKRLRVHFSWWSDRNNPASLDEPARVLIHTTPNIWGYLTGTLDFGKSLLRARIVMAAIPDVVATLPQPLVRIVTRNISTGGTVDVETFNTHRSAVVGPDERHYVDVDLAIGETRDQTYEVKIEFEDGCEPISVCVFEVPPRALVAADGDTLASHDNFFVGARVYDGPLEELYHALDAAYDRMGAVFFAWSAMYSSEQPTVSAGTLTNPWDGSTAVGTNTYGFYTWSLLQGTLDSNNVEVIVWIIVDPGWTGTSQIIGSAEFRDALTTIGHIDVQNYGTDPLFGSPVIIACQVVWQNAGAFLSAKVDVFLAHMGASNIKLLGCGMYAKVPTDPRSIEGLVLYLDADRAGVANGATAAAWPDLSGHANHGEQSTAGARPTYQANLLSGRGAMVFAAGDWMLIPDSASYKVGELTVFVVARCTGTASDMTLVGYPHAATHTSPFWRWGITFASTDDVTVYTNGTAEAFTSDFSTKPLVRSYTLHLAHEGPAERQIERDGAVWWENFSAAAITYPNPVGLRIGGDAVGGNNWIGEIFEILIYDRKLDYLERTAIEEMLAEHHALQLRGTR
jgi:hypothetical protein